MVNADQLFFLSSSQSHLLGDRGPGPVARLQLVVAAPGLSPDTLEERWAAAAGRHDVLRLTFVEKPGLTTFLQGLDDEPAPLTVGAPGQDTRAVADAEWEAALELTRGGLVRAALTDTDLVVTAAAAVADARTLSLLADELLTGRPAAAEPLPFLDFASWERDHLEEDSAEARVGRAYWRGVVDSPAPVASTVATPLRSVELRNLPGAGPDTWLTALALATRATRSHEDDADRTVLAVAVPGRTDDELDVALGPYERYVPVAPPSLVPPAEATAPSHGRGQGPMTLATLRDRLSADVEAASRFALFAPDPGAVTAFSQHLPGLRATVGRHPVELVLSADQVSLWYDPAHLSDRQAGWLAARIAHCAAACVDDADASADGLDLLGDEEREFLESSLTGEGIVPAHASITDAIAAHAKARPTAAAVVHGPDQLTYGELVVVAAQVAAQLSDGDGPVGVLMERSIDAVATAVGVMWAGRAYAALDPAHPPQRLSAQLETAGIDVVVTTAELAERVTSARCIVRSGDRTASDGPTTPTAPAGDRIAYLIFTSGSTGSPKPVAVTHPNLAAYASGVSRRLGLDADSRLAAVTGLSTDLGNTSVYGALFTGGTLEIVPEECISSGARLGELVAGHGVTGLKITPSHLRALLAADDVRLDLPLLVCGGESLDTALVEQARSAGVGRVVNHYGPTETTVGVLTHEVLPEDRDPLPLGRPLPHVRLRVVDHLDRWVPAGQVGELEVSGPAVTAGYVGLDAAAFGVSDTGTARYLTGDLVRVRDDGAVVFEGRVDGQVKVRGHRVDLGDVESHLRAETAVTDAAAIVADDAVRAFVCSSTADLDTTALLRRLSERLPAHMVPSTVDLVSELPRTPSGKVDRTSLAAGAAEQVQSRGLGRAPSSETERVLLDIWRDVIPGAVAGVDDNFFQVGGHSLMATKVIARSRAVFSVDLPLHVIFASPTVTMMAAEIDARLGASAGSTRDEEVDDLLKELEGIDEAEVARLLEPDDPDRAQDD